MTLSRKRRRELDKLKRSADELWEQQRRTMDQAAAVLREARRQGVNYAREEVGPAVHDTYHQRVKPAIATSVAASRTAVRTTRDRFVDDVFPAITNAFGSALAVLEAAKDPRVREVASKVSKSAQKSGLATSKKKSGPGRYILIGLGVAAVASVAYAAWQTLRVDEDLWIEDLADVDAAPAGTEDDAEF